MNAETLHDALNLLPSDLITAADKLRTQPRKNPLRFPGWASTAACAALVLLIGSFAVRNFLPDMARSTESIAEAPAAAAPEDMPAEMQNAAADHSDMDTNVLTPTGEPGTEEGLDEEHRHGYAESSASGDSAAKGYCGNTITTIHISGESFDLAGSDSITITDILIHLNYDPAKVCRCMAEYTVDTETISGIELNLTDSFARCEKGQADLTEEQVTTIREIINKLK